MTRAELVDALIRSEVILARARSGRVTSMTLGPVLSDEVREAVLADPDVSLDPRYTAWLAADPFRLEVHAGLGIPEGPGAA